MPIITTPDGSFRIDDGASPEAIAAARADFMKNSKPVAPVRAGVTAPQLTPEQKAINAEADFREKHYLPGDKLQRKFMQGITANLMDEIGGGVDAATRGVYNAVKQGDLRQIGRTYTHSRDVERELDKRAGDATGGTIAEIAGALANPIGTGAKGLQALKFAPRAVKIGEALERAPSMVQGIAAGANQGTLNAIGASDDNSHLPQDAGNGALGGALTGGVFGGAATGARRAAQIFADRGVAAAPRVAYNHIANMLSKAGISPVRAERELAVANGRGNDQMVMDLSPGLSAQAAAISRRPEVPHSNDMIEQAQGRIAQRPERFETQVRAGITPSTGQDADASIDALTGARKAHGKTDYEAALDGKFAWNHELQDFVDHAPAEIHDAFRQGAHLADLHDQDIGQLGMHIGEDGKPIFNTTPSMRVFDYTKRAMDAKIATALKSDNRALAGGLSNQLNKFKALVSDANPEYAPILAKQRDFYQHVEATNTGLDVISRMRKEPRKVLADLKALAPDKQDDARTGIVQAIVGLRDAKTDPVAFLNSVMSSPNQRAVMEFAFNGKGNLGRFQRYMQREMRARQTDQKIAPGYQSITSDMQAAQHSLSGDIGAGVEHGMRGFAYGGGAGATAAIVRWLDDMRRGLSPSAMDQIAQILSSKGIDLPKNVEASKAFYNARKLKNANAAVAVAKGAQQPYTDMVGK